MKRPALARMAGWIQFLLGLLWAGASVYLLFLIRSPQFRQNPDAADALLALKIGFWILMPIGLLTLAGAYGLWKRARWGWWLSFLMDFGVAVVLVYSLIDDGWRGADAQDIALAAVLIISAVLLLLPPVRRPYWRNSGSQTAPSGTGLPAG